MAPYTATVKRLPKHRVEMTVSFDAALTGEAEKKALERLGSQVKLEGFRPGKAPADMLRAHIDPQRLFEEAVRILLQGHMASLLQEHGVEPIIPPRVEAVTKEPVSLKVILVERPEATVKAGKIKVEKKEMKVEQKDIDAVMNATQAQFATKKTVDRAAKDGDEIVMDFRGTDGDGKEVPGATAEGYEITLGSKQLVPGFEDALLGLKPKEQKTFTVTMPEKYHAKELANKPMTFAVTVQEVREVQKPELNDAFAKEKLSLDSMGAWKTEIEQNIRVQDDRFLKMQREQELFTQITKHTSVDLADELIEEETRALLEEFSARLEERGQSLTDWLTQSKKKPEEAEKEFKEQATERLKLRLGLAALIAEKKIELSQDEVTALTKDIVGNDRKLSQNEVTDRLHNAIWRQKVEKLVEMMLAA